MSTLVVSLFLAAMFVPATSIYASAGHPPCKPPACVPGNFVSISTPVVNANSEGGDQAKVSWSTSPSASTSTVWWYSGYTLIGSKTLASGVHEYTITTGLSPHQLYSVYITATAPSYLTGTSYTVYFRPTDVSGAWYGEVYDRSVTWPNQMPTACAGKTIYYHPKAYMAGDVVHHLDTHDKTSWTPFYFNVHYDTTATQECGFFVAFKLKHLQVRLYAYDDTRPFVAGDPWMAGMDLRPVDYTYLRGDVTFTISAGIEYGPISGGAAASFSGAQSGPPSYSLPTKATAVQPDGSVLMGTVDLEWSPANNGGSADVTFYIAVNNVKAQPHYLETLRFVVFIDSTYGTTDFLGWQLGQNYLYPSERIVMGDGIVPADASAGSADSYCDLQDGTQTISGFPGWP